MRINKLGFKNLNSLQGEWEIDFTHRSFTDSGIFAITGPTGAGKSTILDALCLALYGETPRLSRISKSSNDIMSRRTGDCYAEVVFTTNKGGFICHWSQRRARYKPEGELQQPRHEMSAADSGQLLGSKTTEVKGLVEEHTGMDFTRFTRSMLLAQGGFDAFLKADVSERSSILEEITGTEIYSDISIEVHRKRNEVQGRQRDLEAVLGSIKLMDEEKRKEAEEQFEQVDAAIRIFRESQPGIKKRLKWLENIDRLRRENSDRSQRLREREKELVEFGPQREKLRKARDAETLKPAYQKLDANRQRLLEAQAELESLAKARSELEVAAAELAQELAAQQEGLKQAEERGSERQKLFREVRGLDTGIANLKDKALELERELKLRSKQEKLDQKEMVGLKTQIQTLQKRFEAASLYLQDHASDAELTALHKVLANQFTQLEDLREDIRRYQNRRRQADPTAQAAALEGLSQELDQTSGLLRERNDELAKAELKLSKLLGAKDLNAHRKSLQDAHLRASELENLRASLREQEKLAAQTERLLQDVDRDEQELGRVLQELAELAGGLDRAEARLQEETQRLQFARQVQDLESERLKLRSGEPCPLCGSTDHPYLQKAFAEPAPRESDLKEAQKTLKSLQARANKKEKRRSEIETSLKFNRNILSESDLEERKQLFAARCCQLGVSEPSDELLARLQEENRRQLADLEQLVQTAEEIISGSAATQKEARRLEEKLKKQREEHASKRLKLQQLKSEFQQSGEVLNDLQDKEFGLRKELAGQLEAFGLGLDRDSDPAKLLAVLEQKKLSWIENTELARELGSHIQNLEAGLRYKQESAGAYLRESETRQATQASWDRELKDLVAQRHALLGDTPVEQAEARWQQELETLRTTLKETEKRQVRSSALLENNQKDQLRVAKLLEKLIPACAEEERDFNRELSSKGFTDLEEYLACLLDEAVLEALRQRDESLQNEIKLLKWQMAENDKSLERELALNLTDLSLEEVQQEEAACTAKIEELMRQQTTWENTLAEDRKAQDRLKGHLQKIAEGKELLYLWDCMYDLIGSADGKKYRSFAQGITFEILLAHANLQLQKLSDRYLLCNSDLAPLDLFIIDSYQAGATRTVKNLSGGESFIVSLALALGLSRMSSKNVRIDSLFLDEGFGSLDEDSLELALDNLAALNSEGKLIGVISHVAAIKDRIPCQIQVLPQTGGISRIVGSGCRRISRDQLD